MLLQKTMRPYGKQYATETNKYKNATGNLESLKIVEASQNMLYQKKMQF